MSVVICKIIYWFKFLNIFSSSTKKKILTYKRPRVFCFLSNLFTPHTETDLPIATPGTYRAVF